MPDVTMTAEQFQQLQVMAMLGMGGGPGGMLASYGQGAMQTALGMLPYAAPGFRPGPFAASQAAGLGMPGMLGAMFAHPATPGVGPGISNIMGRGFMGMAAAGAFPDIQGAGGPFGFGPGMGAARGLAGALEGMVGQGPGGPTMGGLTNIMMGAGQAGFFRGVTDIRQARTQMLEMVRQVVDLQRELSMSIDQVTSAMSAMRGLGYTTPQQAARGVREMVTLGAVTGMAPAELMGFGQAMGQQIGRFGQISFGGAGRAGLGGITAVRGAQRGGFLTDEMLLTATGEMGERGGEMFASRIQEMGMRFMRTTPGRFMAAALMQVDPKTGHIGMNQDFLRRVANQDVTIEDIQREAQRNLARLPGGQAQWQVEAPRIMGQAMEATGGMAGLQLLGSITRDVDLNDPRQRYRAMTRLRRMMPGITPTELEPMMEMVERAPQIQQQQRVQAAEVARQAAFAERRTQLSQQGNLQYQLRQVTQRFTKGVEEDLERLINEQVQWVTSRLESSTAEITAALDPATAAAVAAAPVAGGVRQGLTGVTGRGHLYTGAAARGTAATDIQGLVRRSREVATTTARSLRRPGVTYEDVMAGTRAMMTGIPEALGEIGSRVFRSAAYMGPEEQAEWTAGRLAEHYKIDARQEDVKKKLENYAKTSEMRDAVEETWWNLQATGGLEEKTRGLRVKYNKDKYPTFSSYFAALDVDDRVKLVQQLGAKTKEEAASMFEAGSAWVDVSGLTTDASFSLWAADRISGVSRADLTPSKLNDISDTINKASREVFGEAAAVKAVELLQRDAYTLGQNVLRDLEGGKGITGANVTALKAAGFIPEQIEQMGTNVGETTRLLTGIGQRGQILLGRMAREEGGIFSAEAMERYGERPRGRDQPAVSRFLTSMIRAGQTEDVGAGVRAGGTALMDLLARGGKQAGALRQYEIFASRELEAFAEAGGGQEFIKAFEALGPVTGVSAEDVKKGAYDPQERKRIRELIGSGAVTGQQYGAKGGAGGGGGDLPSLIAGGIMQGFDKVAEKGMTVNVLTVTGKVEPPPGGGALFPVSDEAVSTPAGGS